MPRGSERPQQCRNYFLLSSVHLLPEDLGLKHGGAKRVSAPAPSSRPWSQRQPSLTLRLHFVYYRHFCLHFQSHVLLQAH